MQKLNINDIFYSLQGEGMRAGTANIFIRLAKCNLKCSFCDTDFETFKEYTVEELFVELYKYPCKYIIWTGGEPTLQLTDEIVSVFKERGYYQAIETNGLKKIPEGIDFITVSPKTKIKNYQPNIDELKYVLAKGDDLPKITTVARAYIISPMNYKDELNWENINYCVELIKRNPLWRLSLQTQKILKIK